jgi:hypothetical protein
MTKKNISKKKYLTKEDIDYRDFDSGGKYLEALLSVGSGFPVAMLGVISKTKQEHGFTFPEAWEYLVEKGVIIELDDEDELEENIVENEIEKNERYNKNEDEDEDEGGTLSYFENNFIFGRYSFRIRKAIRFATKVHEIDQKQKRKGKDIAYITHPLTLAIILAQSRASVEVIVAGILHDTVEDSSEEFPVTLEMIEEQFGEDVRELVESVTEKDKDLPWEERKKQALEHVKVMSKDQLLLKSADVVANMTELIDDYKEDGDAVFERFNAEKEPKILSQIKLIKAILDAWPENPLERDLKTVASDTLDMGSIQLMQKYPSIKMKHMDLDYKSEIVCPICEWKGIAEGNVETDEACAAVNCPICSKTIIVACW